MASVTALQLVNRVMLNRRQPEITTISSTAPEHAVTLNAINAAKNDILESRDWEFNLRRSQIVLRARIAGTIVSSGSDASVLLFTQSGAVTALESDWINDYVCRLVAESSTDYSNTATRVDSIRTPVIPQNVVVDAPYTAAEVEPAIGGTGYMIRGEYMLPDTVRAVVRASYQERNLSLTQADPWSQYEELFPRPHWEYGPPETIAVGGYDIPTYDNGSGGETPPEPKLRMAVYPVPDDDYIVDYSYIYRHPELTADADVLEGVPESVVGQIVWRATGIVAMAWDQNFAAAHFTDMADQRSAALYEAQRGSDSRRHTINSWAGRDGTLRVVRGFPNQEIG